MGEEVHVSWCVVLSSSLFFLFLSLSPLTSYHPYMFFNHGVMVSVSHLLGSMLIPVVTSLIQ